LQPLAAGLAELLDRNARLAELHDLAGVRPGVLALNPPVAHRRLPPTRCHSRAETAPAAAKGTWLSIRAPRPPAPHSRHGTGGTRHDVSAWAARVARVGAVGAPATLALAGPVPTAKGLVPSYPAFPERPLSRNNPIGLAYPLLAPRAPVPTPYGPSLRWVLQRRMRLP
jgi:hypothetical protein